MKEQLFDQETTQRFFEITNRGRKELWKIEGIDGDAVRTVATNINRQLIKLADDIQTNLKDLESAKAVAEQQRKSIRRLRKLTELEAQGVIPVGVIDDFVFTPSPTICGIAMLAEAEDHSETIISSTPTANISWDPPDDSCVGHPIVDAQGQGNGTLSVSALDAICVHRFVPATTGVFCIRPVIQLSGHYLAWTWGGCQQESGSASVQVLLTVDIEQPAGDMIQSKSQTIIDESVLYPPGPGATQSGFAYDSQTQSGLGVNTLLLSGEEVIIRTTCSVVAEVFNLGRAWVDMQTSPNFYFQVPLVRWGLMQNFLFAAVPSRGNPA